MMDDNAPQTGHAAVNGIEMYYEIHGEGEPLLLLHGGVVGIPMLAPVLPLLSQTRKVIAAELRGHGRSSDDDGPFSHEVMADDVAGLLGRLGIEQADVMGYSLGGEVALQLVIRHPELVRKLVVIAASMKHDGFYPEVLADFERMGPDTAEPMKQSPLSQLFPNVDWGVLFAKLGAMLRQDYDWSRDVAAISAPTLLIFADADAIRPEHIVEFFELLGGGQRDAGLDGSLRPKNQLAILPGQTHYDIIASPTLAAVVTPFLDAPVS
jgi:pimeloyl-ACP methyl ester carboxylesterase